MGDYDYKSIRDKQLGRELVFKIGVYTVAAIVAVPCVLTGNAPGALLSFSIASYVCGSTSVTGAITGTNPISGRTISSDERWVEGISGGVQVLSGAYGIYTYGPQAISNILNTPTPPIRSVADIVDDVAREGSDAVDDVVSRASGAENSIDDIINGVEKGDIKLTNNIQKGNYGEMKMDSYFKEQGYERISLDKVKDINVSPHQGIDGVYYKPDGHPPYVISEAKYGSSQLGKTLDGKQMSDSWITGSNRLENAVGKNLADDILLEGYNKTLVRVTPDGTVVPKILE